jgi:predicted transcriptional regulator
MSEQKNKKTISIDNNNNIDRILKFIHERPACHLRQIKKELNISMGTAQHHLYKLEKDGKITAARKGLYKYYFPIGMFQAKEKNLLQVLNQETARDILFYIVEKKNPSQSDIVHSIGISSPAVNWHISRLMELSLINEYKDGKFKRYKLNIDSKHLIALMKNYYPSIWNIWSGRVAETFLSLSQTE